MNKMSISYDDISSVAFPSLKFNFFKSFPLTLFAISFVDV